jgi:hypothetical protein
MKRDILLASPSPPEGRACGGRWGDRDWEPLLPGRRAIAVYKQREPGKKRKRYRFEGERKGGRQKERIQESGVRIRRICFSQGIRQPLWFFLLYSDS